MKTETKPSISIGLKGRIDYGNLTLLQLADRIVNNSDRQALKELHNNRWLNSCDGKRKYRLAEYIEMKKIRAHVKITGNSRISGKIQDHQ